MKSRYKAKIYLRLRVQMMGLYEKYEYVVVCVRVLYCSWVLVPSPDITFVKAEQ